MGERIERLRNFVAGHGAAMTVDLRGLLSDYDAIAKECAALREENEALRRERDDAIEAVMQAALQSSAAPK